MYGRGGFSEWRGGARTLPIKLYTIVKLSI